MNWEQHKPKEFTFSDKGWIINWFSNMIETPLNFHGDTYNSVENYYQAHKTLDYQERYRIAHLTPSASKRAGRTVKLRPDWEAIKYDVMIQGLRLKFAIPEWKDKLLSTGDDIIIEWNNWNDKVWGVTISDNEGENLLGKALMQIREEFK